MRMIATMACFAFAAGCATTRPTVGSLAPPFDLPSSGGGNVKLADYAGKTLVLAFFPKAFTGG